ncbi:MAG: PfkB family carbohydrate kinase [Archaeoglobaceae archaeon]
MFVAHCPALVDYVYVVDEFPRRGGHAIVRAFTKSAGGAGANVAHNIATLGVDAKIVTAIGRDGDAEFFIANTAAEVEAEVYDRTGRVHVIVDSEGERTFLVEPNAAANPPMKKIVADYIYFDPFPSERSLEVQTEVARISRGFKILNPGFPYASLGLEKLKPMLEVVDMLILSSEELAELGGKEKVAGLVDYLVVTLGAKGSRVVCDEGEFFAEAYPARVVDTTGAGDAFAAGFLYGFMNSLPLETCLKLGNFCGAYNVSRLGARNFPSREEVEVFLTKILYGENNAET